MTARLVRIRAWWLRVPLWSVWFPLVALPHHLLVAALCYPWRLFKSAFWRAAWGAYMMGIEGL
jgi:hypothetical protein